MRACLFSLLPLHMLCQSIGAARATFGAKAEAARHVVLAHGAHPVGRVVGGRSGLSIQVTGAFPRGAVGAVFEASPSACHSRRTRRAAEAVAPLQDCRTRHKRGSSGCRTRRSPCIRSRPRGRGMALRGSSADLARSFRTLGRSGSSQARCSLHRCPCVAWRNAGTPSPHSAEDRCLQAAERRLEEEQEVQARRWRLQLAAVLALALLGSPAASCISSSWTASPRRGHGCG